MTFVITGKSTREEISLSVLEHMSDECYRYATISEEQQQKGNIAEAIKYAGMGIACGKLVVELQNALVTNGILDMPKLVSSVH